MTRIQTILASAVALSASLAALTQFAHAQPRADYQAMAAYHAKANDVPYDLVHRVIMRESKYDASLMGRGGAIGLMQIKLPTARGVGYSGSAEGLRDPNTNLLYGIKYLAGAYRAAHGDHNRAVRYYAGGYYYVAKHQRHQLASAARQQPAVAKDLAKDAEQPKQDAAQQASAEAK
jgi:soluble lytic murein transglycosylase-like protein